MLKSHAFAGNALDRADAKRRDAAWLSASLVNTKTRFVQFAGERPLVHFDDNGKNACILSDAPPHESAVLSEAVFMGIDDSHRAVFAVSLTTDEESLPTPSVPDTVKLIDLRSLATQDLLPLHELGLLSQARSMLQWHGAHSFCSVCGQPSALADGGYRRRCPSCGRDHFPRTDPVVIMVAIDGDRCLLGRSPHFLEGVYSALAGFVEPGETIEEAARREIFEEAGIELGVVTYHSSQPWPFVSSLMIGVIGEAKSTDITMDEEELEDVRWFTRDEARQMLNDAHPQGLKTPAPYAIAHHLIKAFTDNDGT